MNDTLLNKNPYLQLYEKLNLPVSPLPANYSPEEYGKQLRAMLHSEQGVSYATSTDYIADSNTYCNNHFN